MVAHAENGLVTEEAVSRTYFRVAGANVLLYEPVQAGPRAATLLASMHGGHNPNLEQDFLARLAGQGFRTAYCVPDSASYPDQLKSMSCAVSRLRQQPGVARVVLMGHSRGAGLMSAYQRIAERGPAECESWSRQVPFPRLTLEPGDGLALLDANFGGSVMYMMGVNPAVIEEGNAQLLDPDLDAYNPANGYSPDGESHYDEEFKGRFLAAQKARYDRVIAQASERWAVINRGAGNYAGNEPFLVPEMLSFYFGPHLFTRDRRFFSHTKSAWPILHPDGSVTEEIVRCVRPVDLGPRRDGTLGAASVTTVKDFLWQTLEIGEDYDYGADYLAGVDFGSSFLCGSGNVKSITCPLLVTGHTAGHEFIAAEWIFESAASTDKSVMFVEGATHTWKPVDAEQYGDTELTAARQVGDWLAADGRFSV